jgi:hypothetical protein
MNLTIIPSLNQSLIDTILTFTYRLTGTHVTDAAFSNSVDIACAKVVVLITRALALIAAMCDSTTLESKLLHFLSVEAEAAVRIMLYNFFSSFSCCILLCLPSLTRHEV